MKMVDDDDTKGEIEPEWSRRFNCYTTKESVKTLVDKACEGYNFDPQDFQGNSEKANQIAISVRDFVIQFGNARRYKIHVQSYLGERKNQRINIVAKGWWDSYVDNYVSYTYKGTNFYCTVIVWGFYTD